MSKRTMSGLAQTGVSLFAGLLISCASLSWAADHKLKLSGSEEVPPVNTSASGSGVLTVNDDRSLSGSITTTGVVATAAHIHAGARGQNGPVLIPLAKSGDNGWQVPPGTKLSDEQWTRYKAGQLYVNVHSKANPGGEIRAQIAP